MDQAVTKEASERLVKFRHEGMGGKGIPRVPMRKKQRDWKELGILVE